MVQTFYICEQNSNVDYPNIGKYCSRFANDFYEIISGKLKISTKIILSELVQGGRGTLRSRLQLSHRHP